MHKHVINLLITCLTAIALVIMINLLFVSKTYAGCPPDATWSDANLSVDRNSLTQYMLNAAYNTPAYIYSYLNAGPCHDASPSTIQWLSQSGSPSTNTGYIYKDTSSNYTSGIPLQLNLAIAKGLTNDNSKGGSIRIAKTRVVSSPDGSTPTIGTATSTPDLIGQNAIMSWSQDTKVGIYNAVSIPFTFTPNGGAGDYVISFKVQKIQEFNNSSEPYFECVQNSKTRKFPRDLTTWNDFKDVVSGIKHESCDNTEWFDYTISLRQLYYPWLQTINGDVTSLSSTDPITGQLLGRPGSRLSTSTQKEATYVVSGYGTSHFCSTSLFVLGKKTTDTTCGSQTGYQSNQQLYGTDTGFGKINTYLRNLTSSQPNSCSDQIKVLRLSSIDQFSPDLQLGCSTIAAGPGIPGVQQIIASNQDINFGNKTVTGRGTLYVDGNLNITGNIYYGDNNSTNPGESNNFLIVVHGDVKISSNVTRINAAIVQVDNNNNVFDTCSDILNDQPGCKDPLIIYGLVATLSLIHI